MRHAPYSIGFDKIIPQSCSAANRFMDPLSLHYRQNVQTVLAWPTFKCQVCKPPWRVQRSNAKCVNRPQVPSTGVSSPCSGSCPAVVLSLGMESGLFAAAPKITANLQYFSRAAYGEKPILQKCRNFALDPPKKGKLGENDALLQELCRRSAIGSKITAPVQDFFFEGAPSPLAPPLLLAARRGSRSSGPSSPAAIEPRQPWAHRQAPP